MSCLLSIIIVNWNVADILINAIQSIQNNPPNGDYEIIVVDNASSDDSLIKLDTYFSTVRVIANKKNVGFGKANNQGIKLAKGKYILFLNPDTVVLDDALNKLINILEKKKEVGMVGPQLLNDTDLSPQLGCAKLSRSFLSGVFLDLLYFQKIPWIGSILLKALRYPYDFEDERYVEVISGAAMMIRASEIERIGGFDERYFMNSEDIELCDRFRSSGKKVYYLPGAKIIHINQSCTPKNPVDIFVNRFLSVAKYYELEKGKWTHFWFRVSAYLILTPKLLIKALFSHFKKDYKDYSANLEILKKLLKWKFVGDAESFNYL